MTTAWQDEPPVHRAAEDVQRTIRDPRWWRTVMGAAARLAGAA